MKIFPVLILAVVCCGCDVDAVMSVAGDKPISEIQGSGTASPIEGQEVTVTGIVSGDFQDDDANRRDSLGGFYLQSLVADDDPRSSEGLFVFDRNAQSPDVSAGDVVQVSGRVDERFGETQLNASTVRKVGRRELRVTDLTLPAAAVMTNSDEIVIADLERYEGMLVRITQPLYVQDLAGLGRYGDIQLSLEKRQFQFTSTQTPDAGAYREHRARVAAQTLLLDDGRAEQNVSPVRYMNANGLPARAPRIGDAVESVVGVLRYSRGSGPHGLETWRLMPTTELQFLERNPRPSKPTLKADVVVASVNLLNYFSTLDNGKDRCGPAANAGCRGANSAEEMQRQRIRTANAINQSGADIVGLMEIENNARDSMHDLLGALNADGQTWRAVDTGVIGADTIRVAIIYRPDRVAVSGDFAVLDSSVNPQFNDQRNRPALAQTFRMLSNDGRFTLAVNHLKSKGSPCDADGDPNRNDGQGNCNATRTQAARALAAWLLQDPTASDDNDVLIIGDLNAYLNEDPVRALEQAGFDNLVRERLGEEAWSFVFNGESGVLDHALASPSLTAQVTDIRDWHINADETSLYDYNLDYGRDPALFDPSAPWRAADHDPLLIGLTLQAD